MSYNLNFYKIYEKHDLVTMIQLSNSTCCVSFLFISFNCTRTCASLYIKRLKGSLKEKAK